MKDAYLDAITSAGFEDVTVHDETEFSLDCIVNDPTAKAIIDKAGASKKQLEEAQHAVVSIKVKAHKPN